MTPKLRTSARCALIAAVFSLGFLFGAMQSPAQAQLGEMGKKMGSDLLSQAAGSDGMLGQASQLGSTIVDMEKHVSGLQKNIDALNTLKAALGG